MRILILNPNTTEPVTGLLTAAARTVASPGTELVPLTASRGVPYLATRAEAQIGGAIAIEMLAEHHGEADAAIIAAFGDPGLFGARELFDIPVIGMSEAAMLTACLLGRRFAIITFTAALTGWYRDCVEMHGLGERCCAVRALEQSFASIAEVQEEKEELLVALANKAVNEDEAEVVILGGAPLAGLASRVRERVAVPLVDPIAAAVKQAEALVTLSPRKAVAGAFRRPAAKPTRGLPDKLAAWIEHRDIASAAE
ncbi:aspartate/glutamate racemase family protein [Bradyrhizobium sp. ARR65]|uniref:aspartate/glutamate racemase family protein n=1 Tax=Bradyrhizobium sp. ARR65 TaxID=1040989 RepID=UPI000466F8A4|nr:aspartate/glutamate racemase family protein [Bradyrhizobium sp. ARR65]